MPESSFVRAAAVALLTLFSAQTVSAALSTRTRSAAGGFELTAPARWSNFDPFGTLTVSIVSGSTPERELALQRALDAWSDPRFSAVRMVVVSSGGSVSVAFDQAQNSAAVVVDEGFGVWGDSPDYTSCEVGYFLPKSATINVTSDLTGNALVRMLGALVGQALSFEATTEPAVLNPAFNTAAPDFIDGDGDLVLQPYDLADLDSAYAPGDSCRDSVVIIDFAPDFGPPGTEVTIDGHYFTTASAVRFASIATSFTVQSDTRLLATVPPNGLPGVIQVENDWGQGESATPFYVTDPDPPAISSFAPSIGPPGTEVTILGSDFRSTTAVTVGPVGAEFVFISSSEVRATIPETATTGLITLTTPLGTASSQEELVVTAGVPPSVLSFDPVEGAYGALVNITGDGFIDATAVRFGTTPAAFSVSHNHRILATVPTGAATAPISVTTPLGSATSTEPFEAYPAECVIPTITTLSSICPEGSSTAAAARGGVTFEWSITGGTIVGSTTSREVTYTAGVSGEVVLTVLASVGVCERSDTVAVPILAPDAEILAPDSVPWLSGNHTASVADAGPGATHVWTVLGASGAGLTTGQGTPSITFSSHEYGPLTLRVQITDSRGCESTSDKEIDVEGSIRVERDFCSPTWTAFVPVDSSADFENQDWSITGGTITGNFGSSITFVRESPEVILDVTVERFFFSGDNVFDSYSLTLPVPEEITAPAEVVAGRSNVATAAEVPNASYAWSVSNAAIVGAADGRVLEFIPTSAGPVDLSVLVTTESCSFTWTTTVTAGPCTVSIGTAEEVCSRASATAGVPAVAGATYVWGIANGSIGEGQGTAEISYTAGDTGSVELTVSVSANGCTATAGASVSILESPPATITADELQCAGRSGSASAADAGPGAVYEWTVTNGEIVSGADSSVLTYLTAETGTTLLTLNVTRSGCQVTAEHEVAISPRPDATINASSSITAGDVVTASVPDAGSGSTYAWTVTNATIRSGATARQMRYVAAAGGSVTLEVRVTSASGCPNVSSTAIDVAPCTTAITSSAAICAVASETASVADAGSGAAYAWTVTNGTIIAGASTREITYRAGSSGSVTLSVTVTRNGCVATDSNAVSINPRPDATITAPISLRREENASASVPAGTSGTTFSWTVENATVVSGATTRTLTFTPGTEGNVLLGIQVTSPSGCVTTSAASIPIASLPSDADGNGTVTSADAFYLIQNLLLDGPDPVGDGDSDGDGEVTLADVFYLLRFLFAGGPAPQ